MNVSTQENDNKTPYSYHTFIYTFTYSTEKKTKKEKKENQQKNIEEDQKWQKINNVEDIINGNTENEEKWSAYNSLCYFTPKARNAIFNTNTDKTSENYRYIIPTGKTLKYEITLYGQEDTISLPIQEMKLTLFPKIKVGMISINLVNYDAKEEYGITRITRAAQINEYGRRLFFPNIGKDKKRGVRSFIETTGLKIVDGDTEIISINFEEQYKANKNIEIEPQFIDALLGKAIKNEYDITGFSSVFDDRMFTCSLVIDDFISDEMKKYNKKNSEYACYVPNQMISDTNIETSGLLYGYVFIDSDLNYCTCQNKNFRKELLKNHIHDRWIDYGTLYGFTEYSMTCITNQSGSEIVGSSFLTQYVELVKLCLMQRAAINIIETDIVNTCKSIQPDLDESIDIDEISKIWEKYIVFQNELYLPEVTFQE